MGRHHSRFARTGKPVVAPEIVVRQVLQRRYGGGGRVLYHCPAKAAIQYSEAIAIDRQAAAYRMPACAGMTTEKNKQPSRDAIRARAVHAVCPQSHKGAGKTECRLAPAAPVRTRMHGAGTTGSAELTRPSLRDGVTAASRSPWGPAFLPPILRQRVNALRKAPAPGRPDHTT